MTSPDQILGAWVASILLSGSQVEVSGESNTFGFMHSIESLGVSQPDDRLALCVSISVPLLEEYVGCRLVAAKLDTCCLPLYSGHRSQGLVVIGIFALTLQDLILELRYVFLLATSLAVVWACNVSTF